MFFSFDSKKKRILEKLAQDPSTRFSLNSLFEDEALANAVAAELGGISIRDKSVTLNDLNKITSLHASGLGIQNLNGIESLNSLLTANLSGNRILKFPDYSKNSPNLYKNRDSIVYINLKDNPFLDRDRLFSLDASENRRKFFSQFVDAPARFDLGEQKEKVFGNIQINPSLIRLAFERLLPRNEISKREDQLNKLLLKYLIGKQIFHNKSLYQDQYILRNGKLEFKTESINPAYLSDNGSKIAGDLIENMLPQEDLYLIRSLIKTQKNNPASENENQVLENSHSLEELIDFYKDNINLLSGDYILTDQGYKQKEDYSALRVSGISSAEEAQLEAIEDEEIKQDYLRFLNYHDILEQYQREHPERSKDIGKTLKNSDDFVNNYLSQFLSLQNNLMLSDEQRESLSQAGPALKRFVDNFVEQARAYFDQDIFGLEVEMKYIDMLAAADKKFGN